MRKQLLGRGLAMVLVLALAGACVPGAPAGSGGAAPKAAGAGLSMASHEEIVAGATKEGQLRVLTGLSTNVWKGMAEAFKQKYPSIALEIAEIDGTDAYARLLLEMQSGTPTKWDVMFMPSDQYPQFLPFMKKVDILGMAEKKVLNIPAPMIDPENRNTIGPSSTLQVVAFNKKQIAPEKVPGTWEGFLAPEFAGRKVVADIRGLMLAGLAPAWGLEKTVDFGKKLAGQQPVWIRGGSQAMTSVQTGEYTVFLGPNYNTVERSKQADKTDSIDYKIPEPIAVRGLLRADGITESARNVNAALLWLEFQASQDGQDIMDKNGPFEASMFVKDTQMEKLTRGKQLSLVDWKHFTQLDGYAAKLVESFGFPKAE